MTLNLVQRNCVPRCMHLRAMLCMRHHNSSGLCPSWAWSLNDAPAFVRVALVGNRDVLTHTIWGEHDFAVFFMFFAILPFFPIFAPGFVW